MDALANYRQLVAKVDAFCSKIGADFAAYIACRAGCAGCCRDLTLFPVEAMALAESLNALPEDERERIRQVAAEKEEGCPLLHEEICLLYEARPLICRTHGLPLLVSRAEGRQVDYCSLNFTGLDALPGSAVLDIDRLNEALVTINAVFATSTGWGKSGERIPIADALLLDLRPAAQ